MPYMASHLPPIYPSHVSIWIPYIRILWDSLSSGERRALRSELGVFTFTFEIVPILYGEPFGATNGVSEASDSNTVGYNSYNMGRPSDVNVDVNVGF